MYPFLLIHSLTAIKDYPNFNSFAMQAFLLSRAFACLAVLIVKGQTIFGSLHAFFRFQQTLLLLNSSFLYQLKKETKLKTYPLQIRIFVEHLRIHLHFVLLAYFPAEHKYPQIKTLDRIWDVFVTRFHVNYQKTSFDYKHQNYLSFAKRCQCCNLLWVLETGWVACVKLLNAVFVAFNFSQSLDHHKL